MPGWDYFAPLAVFAFSSLATPGPNNIIIAASGANFGLRKSMPIILGVCIGFSAMVLLVAFGVAELLQESPLLLQALRWCGFAFLLYLAWKLVGAKAEAAQRVAKAPSFVQMVLFQWINPKAWAMSTAAAAFNAGTQNALMQACIIALVFLCIALPCQMLWGLFGSAMGKYLRAKPLRLRVFNCIMALLMVGAFIPVLLQ